MIVKLLGVGVSEAELWDITPGIAGQLIRAREKQQTQLAWKIAVFSRTDKLKPLENYTGETMPELEQEDEDDDRQRVKKTFNLG